MIAPSNKREAVAAAIKGCHPVLYRELPWRKKLFVWWLWLKYGVGFCDMCVSTFADELADAAIAAADSWDNGTHPGRST